MPRDGWYSGRPEYNRDDHPGPYWFYRHPYWWSVSTAVAVIAAAGLWLTR